MSTILLSIKPEYIEAIFKGTKKYEFRRARCKKHIDKIVIYATAPVSQVVAEVEVLDVLEDKLDVIWHKTKDFSGITKEAFKRYYKGKNSGVVYKLGTVTKYKEPKNLADYGIKMPLQSFVYV